MHQLLDAKTLHPLTPPCFLKYASITPDIHPLHTHTHLYNMTHIQFTFLTLVHNSVSCTCTFNGLWCTWAPDKIISLLSLLLLKVERVITLILGSCGWPKEWNNNDISVQSIHYPVLPGLKPQQSHIHWAWTRSTQHEQWEKKIFKESLPHYWTSKRHNKLYPCWLTSTLSSRQYLTPNWF